LRRIYFSVFGSGLGHVTRVLDIAERLRKNGDEFRYSCSLQALDYLSTRLAKDNILASPPLDVEWTEGGSFSSKDFIPHFPYMFNSFARQVAFEAEHIAKFDPGLVVSDSRLSTVLGARSKSYPIVTMLNQFKVTMPPRFRVNRIGRFYERIAGDVLGLLWSLSDQVLMTDLPPPYTIGEANLEGTDVSKIVRYVGFTSPRVEMSEERLSRAKQRLGIDSRPLVFFQISGPDATKQWLVDTVLRSTDALASRYNVVVSLGYLHGSGEPSRLANGTWLYEWCPIKDELFMLSGLVVSRSGHGTIGQCIDAGKPAVLIPIHNHSEQLGNAEKFSRLGLGLAIRSQDLNAQRLTEAADQCLNDSRFSANVEALSAISKRYDGVGNCAEIINSYND
jgi:UDP-N-acetylglucosamine--N-acetylmuramyl-(pentapeptide) pyrophosphoryl-undecaprenol N-acetylglucosamine transferase